MRYATSFLILLLTLLSISCSHSNVSYSSTASTPAVRGESIPTPDRNRPQEVKETSPQGAIRAIDFRNFTYPWYPEGLTPPHKGRQLTLQDGKVEVDENRSKNIERASITLDNVSYADLTGDGKEEAIVTLGGVVTFNSFVNCIFVYSLESSAPRLLWLHETGDRANGGLRSIRVEDANLVVEQYDIKFNWSKGMYEDGAALCCPKKFIRSYYSWNGRTLQKIKSDILPNEYENAKFLGYPTS